MELAESAAEMGVSIRDAWTGWGGCMDVRNFFHRGGSGGVSLRVGVVGHVPTDWEGTGQYSPSRDTVAEGADTTSEQICGYGTWAYLPPIIWKWRRQISRR